jgi:hypothetical protein
VQMVELTVDEVVSRERLASYAAEAVIRAHVNCVEKKDIRWRIMRRRHTFKLDHGYEDQDLFEESRFHDKEVNCAKRELCFQKGKARHDARMLHSQRVELEARVAQLNTFWRQNA